MDGGENKIIYTREVFLILPSKRRTSGTWRLFEEPNIEVVRGDQKKAKQNKWHKIPTTVPNQWTSESRISENTENIGETDIRSPSRIQIRRILNWVRRCPHEYSERIILDCVWLVRFIGAFAGYWRLNHE